MYHSHIILFSAQQLSEILFPGLFHELRTQTKWPKMFENTISTPSLYTLPSYISADKLIHELRTTLASSLVFIHSWFQEHSFYLSVLDHKYSTYEDFFNITLSLIIGMEDEDHIREIACDLKQSVKRVNSYLGTYHGNLGHVVHSNQDVINALIVIYLISMMPNL
jgi:hypothetical protein